MDSIRTDNLITQVEALVAQHIETSRQAVADAVQRAFSKASVEKAGLSRSRSASKAPSKRETSKSSPRRSSAELAALGQRLYSAVDEKPGETMAVLANQVGLSPRELHRPMTLLRTAGRVRCAGQRSRTRYYPMDAEANRDS